ncbi:MAG: hypothetical protein CFE34_11290 [Rhodobacteraceae bacterium PARR1]|nr:MAG: hypothetical protein CFE34_11290 [Rhodobacteraceae bacterium PARR1]
MSHKAVNMPPLAVTKATCRPVNFAGNREKALILFIFQQFTAVSHSLLTEPEKRNSVPIHEVGQSDREQKNNVGRAGLPALFYIVLRV